MKPYDPTYMEAFADFQANEITINVKLASRIGWVPALLLGKIVYLCHKDNPGVVLFNGNRWAVMSFNEFRKHITPWIPERTLRRAVSKLEEAKLIFIAQDPKSTDRSNYYRPNEEAIYHILTDEPTVSYAQMDGDMPSCQSGTMEDANVAPCNMPEWHDAEKSDDTINELKKNKELKDKDKELKDPAPLKKRRTSVRIDEPRPRDLIFDAVAEVTQFDPKLTGSRIAKTSNALKKAGYIPEDVTSFLGWWKQNDFRWKQSKQLPLPEDVINLIARSKTSSHGPLSEPTNLYPADYVPGMTVKEYTERNKHVTN